MILNHNVRSETEWLRECGKMLVVLFASHGLVYIDIECSDELQYTITLGFTICDSIH